MNKAKKFLIGLGSLSLAMGGVALGTAVANGAKRQTVKADYSVSDVIENPGASFETQRVWVYFINSDSNSSSNFWAAGAALGIGLNYGTEGASYKRIKSASHHLTSNGQDKYLYFFDVPLSAKQFKFLRCNPSYSTVWGECGEVSALDNSMVYQIDASNFSGVAPSSITAGASSFIPDAYLWANVLRGYLTCNNSTKNGYGAVTSLTSTWYSSLDATVNGNVNTLTLEDYPKSSVTAGEYATGSTKSETVTCAAKWAAMEMMSTRNGNWTGLSLNFPNNSHSDYAVPVVLGSLAAIFGVSFVFYRKRKSE